MIDWIDMPVSNRKKNPRCRGLGFRQASEAIHGLITSCSTHVLGRTQRHMPGSFRCPHPHVVSTDSPCPVLCRIWLKHSFVQAFAVLLGTPLEFHHHEPSN
ncbi:hypothetical protein LIA77_10238 [Sarocladium implicatum]|nr:hypothetical protein LIA77_10238 [Sarocladium implicatum]